MVKRSRARTHSDIEWLDAFGAKTKLSAYGLWHYGRDFLAHADTGGSERFSPATYFCVVRSIELFLKAFLSIKGTPLDELSSGRFSHKLAELLERAKRDGLFDVAQLSPEQIEVIHQADRYYGEKVFEYPAVREAVTAYKHLPDFNLLASAANNLCESLKSMAQAA